MDAPRHRAKRSLGQNFLQDDNISRKIVLQAGITGHDMVLEIGPGQGALTRFIRESVAKGILLLEKDDLLAADLERRWPDLEVIRGDALRFGWEDLDPAHPWKIVGNLPYNVASPIIWEVVSRARSMERAVFMIQKEVGRRLCAPPGGKEYGALSVWVQSFTRAEFAFVVPPTVFRPRPKVDSAVVILRRRQEPPAFNPLRLAGLVKRCFQQRRKQLKKILKADWCPQLENGFEALGLRGDMRPERVTPEQYQALSKLDKITIGP